MTTTTMFSGVWKNEFDSMLTISVEENGVVRGQFCTMVGRAETKHAWDGNWFDVIGFANGSLISFLVNYDKSHALSANVGTLVSKNGEEQMVVKGHFLQEMPPELRWMQTIATSNTFVRVNEERS